ncbi:hypothetical protein GTY81_19500 [Streptomyces sp. SID8366]|uniref:hypothetical protein n=1 Tax=unclassified Streptomyces TaxID=2593676 RepID=UPI000DBA5D66|nr:hypothetical protein [Streptomyces sp. PsTaAH-130]MYU06029.1 hypothetical protein [Streptomyces sp. SID8366]MYU67460.1 hypothetical protein [Streptomyces sp. SID69]RAJ64091.1 hypothetical protein K376_01187 [Streptomyces sp. PsTaAH-130]
MPANPPTVPEPEPATMESAASAKAQLDDALREAAFRYALEVADDERALHLTVYSSRPPFDGTVEAATEWLRRSGIDATAARDEQTFRVVLTFASADSVHTLIAAQLQPWSTARTTAQQLEDVLSDLGVDSTVDVGTKYLNLHLTEDELGPAITLARLLGAPGLGEGLQLSHRRGIRRLTERIQWLITGVVGSEVSAEAEPACWHEPDRLTIEVSLDQARRLTERLRLAEVADLRNGASQ